MQVVEADHRKYTATPCARLAELLEYIRAMAARAVEFSSEEIRLDHCESGALSGKQRRACRRVADHRDTSGAPARQVDLAHAIEVHIIDRVHSIQDLGNLPFHVAERVP